MTAARPTPALLVILDGFGHREPAPDNAISQARMPFWQRLLTEHPHGLIEASEHHVGLPAGQFGNSEVGHLNLGAGRIVYQDLTRVDHALETGEFQTNPVLTGVCDAARASGGTLHVLGLLSPGGVHSHERHIHAMLRLAHSRGLSRVALHAFLDGRDVPPRSAGPSLAGAEAVCAETGARIASVSGRFYAMDRDKRWERIETAYRAIVEAQGPQRADTAAAALEAAYARGETDEFVPPTVIGEGCPIRDGDAVIFMNFRADRARELTTALTDASFSAFVRRQPQLAAFACLSFYGEAYAHLPIAFRNETIEDSFGEVVAQVGLAQLRIAETEKYAHVTYFFSGGREQPFPGEERILVPSPKVATYDLMPEMSAPEVTERLLEAIGSKRFSAIVVNYANGDMVGHTGVLEAAIRAVETLDACLARLIPAARAAGYEVLITADHGNCEQMFDAEANQAHTQHTTERVPLVYVGQRAGVSIREGGTLRDVAPTLLECMGLPKPGTMTGSSLIERRL